MRSGPAAVALALTFTLIAPALAQQDDQPVPLEGERPPTEAAPRVPYRINILGVQGELRDLLEAVSETAALIERPPATLAGLRRRARADIPRLTQALRSRGYYDAEVGVEIDPDREPVRVAFRAVPGDLYRLRDITIEEIPPDSPFEPPSPADLGLAPGQPAAARPIIDAEAELLRTAQEQGFALAELGARTAAIERGAGALDLTLRIEPGPRVRLGEIEITGLTQVEEGFVRRRLGLEPGDRYDPVELDAARERLVESGLFSAVAIRLAEEATAEDRLPVTVEVAERPHRSIGLGVNYWTDVGIGGNVSWEHRNFFGRGEQVRIEAEGSGFGSTVSRVVELSGSFRKPDVGRLNQALIAEGNLSEASTEAFDSRSVGAQVGVERQFAPRLHGTLGLAYRAAQVEGAGEDQDNFGLVSVPAGLRWDTSDSLLDPSEGGRLRLDLAPFYDTFGNAGTFAKGTVSYSRYHQVADEPRIVLAGRAAVGTLFGAERDDVPADERFYAGGGGSIRGYGFQLASPLNDDDEPVGGRSMLELAGEVRGQITETIGAVVFLDAGTAFEASVPDFDEDLLFGAGVGLRYFTPIGPLRLDVAVPLNPRDVDDSFQLYISFGQAF